MIKGMIKIKYLIFIIAIMVIAEDGACGQDTQDAKYSKSITAGVSTAVASPFFLNGMINGGFRMYNQKANIGYGLNTEVMWRHKLDNFIVSLTDIKVYRRICRNAKMPVDVGLAAGFGINTAPEGKFLLTSVYFAVPLWKLHFEVQPTVVIPGYKSSFVNLNIAYYFNLKK